MFVCVCVCVCVCVRVCVCVAFCCFSVLSSNQFTSVFCCLEQEDKPVAFCSTQAHYSVKRAAMVSTRTRTRARTQA